MLDCNTEPFLEKIYRTFPGKNSSWFLGMYMPMFMLKTHYFFLSKFSNTHEIWEFWPIFHAFYAHNHCNFMHSSCPALFMPSSSMFMGMNIYELGMNKGFNPIFHVHESYSHEHMKSYLYFMHISHC